MSCVGRTVLVAAALLLVLGSAVSPPASAEDKKSNILVIMGDDGGWFNIGAYHQGMMSRKTPNLDKLAAHIPVRCRRSIAGARRTSSRGSLVHSLAHNQPRPKCHIPVKNAW